MSIRTFFAVILASLMAGLAPAFAQIPPTPPGWQLERAVVLSRHGVRSPIESSEELNKLAAMPWPTWPVASGDLTPRGAELMALMGGYYRVLYGGRGLIQADDCPPAGIVVVWADVDQRTRASADSLLSGLYGRCGLTMRHQADLTQPDPLFHPQPSASCPMDPAANRAAILARIGGDFGSVLREYARPLATLQATLCPPRLSVGHADCGLKAAAAAIEPRRQGGVAMKGPIAIGAMAAETFLMESAEGMPAAQVAWGRLSGEGALHDVMAVRLLEFDLMQRTPVIARQKGSNMLAQILTTLQDGHKFPGAPAAAEPARLALLVGHDTNIANIAGLLNASWEIPGFQPNDASPGGALAFELFREVRYRPALCAVGLLCADARADAPSLEARREAAARQRGGRSAGLQRRDAQPVLPAAALRRDRHGRDRSGLRHGRQVAGRLLRGSDHGLLPSSETSTRSRAAESIGFCRIGTLAKRRSRLSRW